MEDFTQQDMELVDDIPKSLVAIQHKWPLIARDIVLMFQPQAGTQYTADDIINEYKLTKEDFVRLTKLPVFIDIVRAETARLRELGPMAGYKIRTEALITDIQERLYLRIREGSMDDKSALQYLSILMKSIGLEQPPQQPGAAPGPINVPTQNNTVNISFNVPKLPKNKKLAHLLKQPQNNIIDVGE